MLALNAARSILTAPKALAMLPLWTWLLTGAVALGVSRYIFHKALRRSLAPSREIPTIEPKAFGLTFQEVCFPTANQCQLKGWLIPAAGSDRSPAAILLHGWGGNAATLLPLAQPLHDAGFTVLLFDARCHGRSDEDSFASLPRFAEDMEHALDWLQSQPQIDPRRIALIGHSVGAGAALLLAARRDDVAAVVSLSAFSHPHTMMRRFLAAKHVPYIPIGWYCLRYVQHIIGHRFDDIAPVNTIRRLKCPALLVHGQDDVTVPVTEAHTIYAARPDNRVHLRLIQGTHDDFGDIEQEAAELVDFLRGELRDG